MQAPYTGFSTDTILAVLWLVVRQAYSHAGFISLSHVSVPVMGFSSIQNG